MFDSIGWGEILVIGLAGLFVLGPERLPGAAAWLGRSLRQVKEFAAGATAQVRDELGPEFDELRRPLAELNRVRGRGPRAAVLDTLLSDGPAAPAAEPAAAAGPAPGATPGSAGGARVDLRKTPTDPPAERTG